MAAIYLLGGTASSLQPVNDLKLLRELKASNEQGFTYLEDLMSLAKDVDNKKAYKILKRNCRRYQLSKLWPFIDQSFCGGLFRRLYRKFAKPDWLNWRVTLHGPKP